MGIKLRKTLCAVLSAAMVTSALVLPISASADTTPLVQGDTVTKEWKLDFGAEGSTPQDGYTLVTPDAYIAPDSANDYDYGFMGTNADDYALTNRYDGWVTQKGQVIELAAGNDAIGVVGAGGTEKVGDNEVSNGKDIYDNKADKYYPVRFAMKVPDETYYRVKATVTTLDPTRDATASLYTERKHPIYTEKTIAAGTTDTVTFSVRVTPLYYEKSDPKGTIADRVLSVGVLGENSALASLEIQQVETIPTFWILGDSTVTDGNTTLPFFALQNYTGYGTGFMKYLPRNMAMVNAGEGGLASGDIQHFNIVANRIKEGDYLFFEYGHNESEASYAGNLQKYYDLTHGKKAKLIISSPAERINIWDKTSNKYTPSLEGYQTKSKEFAEAKVKAGADDIAFVGLSTASINFINKVVADHSNSPDPIRFYYQTTSGGATDTTHFNDVGAENIAYLFFEEAKKVTDATYQAVLKPILDDMTDETPNPVSETIISKGFKSDEWPKYVVPTTEKYPALINEVLFGEDGKVASASVTTRAAEISLDGYGILVITINSADGTEKGKIYANIQVDNSTGFGTQEYTPENFTGDVTLEEGDTYSAVVLEAVRDSENNLVVKDNGTVYSAVYRLTDIAQQLLINSRNDDKYENFDYVGVKYDGTVSFIGLNNNGWMKNGSSGMTLVLNAEDTLKYADISIDGMKGGSANQGSFTMAKALSSKVPASGRYLISADIRYVGGGGTTFNLTSNYSDKNIYGTGTQELFTVGSSGKVTAVGGEEAGAVSATGFTNVQAILDCDLGTLEVTVEGNNPVTVQLDAYKTTELVTNPSEFTHFMIGGEKKEWHLNVANLQVAKMKDKQLPTYSMAVNSSDPDHSTITMREAAPLSYAGGKAIVNADKDCVLLETTYNADKTLKTVIPHELTFTEEGIQEISVESGSTLMLWDGLKTMKPLSKTVTAQRGDNDPYELNTAMEASVTVSDGYVFMGWMDANDSNKIVSMDPKYKFRLRADTALTAKIVPEPTVADITTFAISAVPTGIKATEGSTAAMKISDAADANGTPMSKVTNADVTWSCTEAGISIDTNGVLTVGSELSMGSSLTKEITITGTLNGIAKTCKLTLFAYEYFENMAEGATKFDGTFMTIAGKTAIVFPGEKTTSKYKMAETVKLDAPTTVKFDHVWSGSKTCGQKRELQFKNSSGTTIFSMYYEWASLKSGDGTIEGAVDQNSYKTVTAVIDPTAKTVTISVDGVTGTITTSLVDKAGDIAGIDFVSAGSVPAPTDRSLGISNLTIIK